MDKNMDGQWKTGRDMEENARYKQMVRKKWRVVRTSEIFIDPVCISNKLI